MMENKIKSIAGMSLGGGRKENFFFCLLEYFEDKDRWFLTTLNQVNEEGHLNKDEAITNWVENYELKKLIVDFPLSKPPCESCDLICPGMENCNHPVVNEVNSKIHELLVDDQKFIKNNPKRYEQERIEDSLINYSKSVLEKETHHHILSKSFKRKLKKGFTPYWNRPLDFWIWYHYYDQMLKMFNITYDSFGTVSIMLMHKFHYLLRHLPNDLEIFESNIQITLIELYRSGIISQKNIIELNDIDVSTLARVRIVKQIEEKLKIFIYNKDLDIISKNSKAFESFILSVSGHALISGSVRKIPDIGTDDSKFIAPLFP